MEISERIKKLGNYFDEMKVVNVDGEQVIYVTVSFPRGWVLDEEFAAKKKVTIIEGTNIGQYSFCTTIDVGEQAIFDTIDENVKKMHEAIERGKLLNEKKQELIELFQDESISIEKLRTIKFSMDDVEVPEIVVPKASEEKKGKKNE